MHPASPLPGPLVACEDCFVSSRRAQHSYHCRVLYKRRKVRHSCERIGHPADGKHKVIPGLSLDGVEIRPRTKATGSIRYQLITCYMQPSWATEKVPNPSQCPYRLSLGGPAFLVQEDVSAWLGQELSRTRTSPTGELTTCCIDRLREHHEYHDVSSCKSVSGASSAATARGWQSLSGMCAAFSPLASAELGSLRRNKASRANGKKALEKIGATLSSMQVEPNTHP